MTRAAARVAAGTLATAAVLAMSAAPASAHAALTGATPAKGATVPAPAQIVLEYSDPVRLPHVVLTDASGAQRQSGDAKAVDNKVTQQVTGTLPDGRYKVGWRVVSADGHPVSGTYDFTVQGSSTGAQPAPPPPTQAATEDDSENSSSGWLWIGLIAVIVAAAGGTIVWFRRSSGPDNT